MSQIAARVENVDAIKAFRTVLIKFSEAAMTSLSEADSEVQRTLIWLETEQRQFWEMQVRKCQEMVSRAADALRQKKLFKDSSGRTPSAIDEEKALQLAKRRLEEAERRALNTKRHARQLQKEIVLYKGQVQRFATTVECDLPTAATHLSNMVAAVEAYLALNAPGGEAQPAAGESAPTQAAETDGLAAMQFMALRLRTPSADQRDAAENRPLQPGPWKSGRITDAQLQALAAVKADRTAMDANLRLTVAPGIAAMDRICCERAKPASNRDSGWYFGPADDSADSGLVAMSIAELLAIRPDFGELLALPEGCLALFDPSGLKTVVDGRDQVLLRL